MNESPLVLARDLIKGGADRLETLRIHKFDGDLAAHDDELQQRVQQEFIVAFDRLVSELTEAFGSPLHTDGDNECVPLCGVFRSAVWVCGSSRLFAATAHEDRECPYILVLGARAGDADAAGGKPEGHCPQRGRRPKRL